MYIEVSDTRRGKIRSINSKQKGKRAELELAHRISDYGYECRRTAQYAGKTEDSADVIGLDYIHIECKHNEHLNIDDALDQAKRDCKGLRIPCVFHRKNRTPWKVTMDLDDFMTLYAEYYSSMKLKERM